MFNNTGYSRAGEFKTSRPGKKLFFRDGMIIGISDYGLQIIDTQTASKQPLEFIDFLNPTAIKAIKDIDKSSDYARSAIIALLEQDIISGDENGYFYPKNEVTRSQMVKVLVNSLEINLNILAPNQNPVIDEGIILVPFEVSIECRLS
ncbi:MAG: S-layer homology domain-containing protein [Lutispora sp.]|nr:S-layer homology domain-containing protein [Lutispora sp.]MDD4834221.1 S-layer homology domain-containing protein [Lutispora sp.]